MNILTTRCKRLRDQVLGLTSNDIIQGNTIFGVQGSVLPQDFSGGTATPFNVSTNKKFISNNKLNLGKLNIGRVVTDNGKYAYNANALVDQQYKKDSSWYVYGHTSFMYTYWYNGSMAFSIHWYCGSSWQNKPVNLRVEWLAGDDVIKTYNYSVSNTNTGERYMTTSTSIDLNSFLSISKCRIVYT